MADETYRAARREAATLLRDHWDGALAVRLLGISTMLGATKYEADLGPALSGMVAKETGGPPRIALNSTHSAGRRRFTSAHELGHIVERGELAQDERYAFTDARGGTYDTHEFFADEFAGALLLPAEDLLRHCRAGSTMGQLAQLFGVSVAAVQKRLERLAEDPEAVY